MNKSQLEQLIREEMAGLRNKLDQTLSEEYQDKFRLSGRITTNLNSRSQNEILSDIRAITGVTIVSTREVQDYGAQSFSNFNSILNLKIDGYPFITKGGFSRKNVDDIAKKIQEVPDVISFRYSPKSIEAI